MGRTSFSGPVYGAKCLLATVSKENIAASAADLEILEVDIPAGEDWYITRVCGYCDVQGNGGFVDVEDDGASILGGNLTLVSDDAVNVDVTADSGEDEGKRVASGSVLTVDVSNGATTAIEDLTVSIYGYIRRVQ